MIINSFFYSNQPSQPPLDVHNGGLDWQDDDNDDYDDFNDDHAYTENEIRPKGPATALYPFTRCDGNYRFSKECRLEHSLSVFFNRNLHVFVLVMINMPLVLALLCR